MILAGLATAEIIGGAFEVNWLNQLNTPRGASNETQQELIEKSIRGLITRLPSDAANNAFAWTIDDASESLVLGKYLDRAVANNLALTFFVNSSKHSWLSQAEKLHPLIKSGQIQLANHSHRHLDLTTLSDWQVRDELASCHSFLMDNFGVDARPFWRPPFRKIDQRVAKIAADLGYSTPTMWSNNLLNASAGASTERVQTRFESEAVAGAILLDHMHGLETDAAFATAIASLRAKNLKTLTLRQAFAPTSN